MRKSRHRKSTLAWQMFICVAALSIWQWGYDLHSRFPSLVPDLLDPYFVSKPSEIFPPGATSTMPSPAGPGLPEHAPSA